MKLDESVSAVVTGGASGLGKATVTALREKGVKVAIFDLNRENGERVAKELGALYCEVNVMDEDGVDAGFAKARAENGQERILVNCAGGGRGGKTIARDKKTGEIVPFKLRGNLICKGKVEAYLTDLLEEMRHEMRQQLGDAIRDYDATGQAGKDRPTWICNGHCAQLTLVVTQQQWTLKTDEVFDKLQGGADYPPSGAIAFVDWMANHLLPRPSVLV